jgi:hypothetical protein
MWYTQLLHERDIYTSQETLLQTSKAFYGIALLFILYVDDFRTSQETYGLL